MMLLLSREFEGRRRAPQRAAAKAARMATWIRRTSLVRIVCLSLLAACGGSTAFGQQAATDEPTDSANIAARVDFSRDVRPILADNCYFCHGPDRQQRQAELRLDEEASAKADRDGYAVIVPGDPEASELIARVMTTDPDLQMPPPDSQRSLTAEQKETLRRWIEQGAEWQQHWSFVPATRPPLPSLRQPEWALNPIDYFLKARLESQGLTPSPAASKENLLRRVTFDLTGLPPTLTEIEQFVNDTSPDAYERVVDRLLASPAYGEAMALMWLDAARYADTDGYQNDGPREMWRWRDWVLQAYNAGMPFDQFTIEQLAGDLLPNAGLDQRIATGFNRNHRYNSEAGLVLEEFLLENAVDRVDTTSTVWMGLTMGCARCHDHKNDPFSQQEYYQLIAFFDKVSESGRAVKFGNSEPWVIAPTRLQQEELASLQFQVEQRRETLGQPDVRQELERALQAWRGAAAETAEVSSGTPPNATASPRGLGPSRGLVKRIPLDAPASPPEEMPDTKATPAKYKTVPGVLGQAARFDGNSQQQVGCDVNFHCESRFSISFWMRPEEMQQGVVLSKQSGGTRRPGVAVELRDGHLQFSIITRWVAGVAAVETVPQLPADTWVHVTLTNDGSQSARGMRIYLDGAPAETTKLYNTNSNTGGAGNAVPLRLGGGVQGANYQGALDEVRLYSRTLWEDEIRQLALPESVETLATRRAEQSLSDEEQSALEAWYLEHAAPPALGKLAEQYYQARTRLLKFRDTLPTSMVMDHRSDADTTHVHIRGEYNQLGEAVQPDVPSLLLPMPTEASADRRGFAEWLLADDHPLTARVAVNRYWQRYFGTGLVKTSEDFGLQGELPSHPELLDWLAVEFRESGWDVKAMQRLIVTSATYRQASAYRPELSQVDPENRLLARFPRQRLSAHAIRDRALQAAGLLVSRQGGPSVSPYQPANLWREMSNMAYRQSKGSDLFRRSLYTIWKRTVAPPSLSVLDAADRETCRVRPQRTNTPLQALTLLNEITFVEAARGLAERMLTEGKADPLRFGFRIATSRQPEPRELAILQQAWERYRQQYRADPKAATQLIELGESQTRPGLDPVELAAATTLANLLLNLDEAITKP